jgi:hypothetical protein
MTGEGNSVVVYVRDRVRYKLTRVILGGDGSYYVTCPYHADQAERAAFLMHTVNYAMDSMDVKMEDAIDIGAVDDPDRGIKLSHHPDGFLQFSGPGLTSGREQDGSVKGFGIMSWPLDQPPAGPAFAVTIRGLDHFETEENPRGGDITFSNEDVMGPPEPRIYTVEGFYFTPEERRFVRPRGDGTLEIAKVHPSGLVVPLRVLLPGDPSRGFVGIDFYAQPREDDMPGPDHGFIISTSTGNLRKTRFGALADGMACVVPGEGIDPRRLLNYPPPEAD